MDKEQVLRKILELAHQALTLSTSLMPPQGTEDKQSWDEYFTVHHPLWESVFIVTKAVERLEEAAVKEVA